ncbi:MAG TPA: methylated-DNA--[protein]-cysteine S-methyltransferase [Gemmatimonadales bacterium]|nr:methylated-DNA--[protein]-cysteine S-methyltransferase [Gemmatimonadales bacterium]
MSDLLFTIGECSLGSLLIARSQGGVCAILLGDDADSLARELAERYPDAALVRADGAFADLVPQVVEMMESPGKGPELLLDVRGTVFQQRVWQALREIPPGSTATYGEIATRIGAPRAVRAVAQACAANPIAVAIPCHRVVRSDGRLSGYRWGVGRKRVLLQREATA